MTAFAAASAGPLTAEPDKRVHYTLGLVLGVDEFQQEQLYHMAGRRSHARLLHGYGTVSGLAVSTPEPGTPDPEIQVSAGVAVDPCGREICVPETMCVRLTSWLDRYSSTLDDLFPGGIDTLPLAVVLCYRECPTDVVPIPGEPCRTQDDAMEPSRVRDSFELRLALREEALAGSPPEESETGIHVFRPDHAEEEAIRAFGELLGRVETVSVAAPGVGREELLEEVRALGAAEWEPSSLPSSILLPSDEADDALREAFRVWVTEVRPRIRAREPVGNGCDGEAGECCVLLAEVDLPVTADWAVRGVAFEAREEDRPVLLQSRLLQEWRGLAGAASGNDDTFATVEPLTGDTVRVWLHYPEPLDLGADGVQVAVDDAAPEAPAAVDAVAGVDNVFDVRLGAAPADGARVELLFDLETIVLGADPAVSLADALHTEHGGLLDRYGGEVRAYTIFRVHTAAIPDYEQDLSGSHPAATVVGLQGNPVSAADPGSGDVLTWDGDEWAPAGIPVAPAPALPPGEGDVAGTYPDLEVVGLRGRPIGDPAPSDGQVLTWDGTSRRWQPADPAASPSPSRNVVSALEPGYAIVAAGFFDVEGTAQGPTLGRLRAVPLDSLRGHYNLQFRGYEPPEDRITYIVKGTAQAGGRTPAVVEFVSFFDRHLRIRVVDLEGSGDIAGFMVEISRFPTER